MKLKQRVVVTGTLFLGMSLLFLVGILFGSSREGSETAEVGGDVGRINPPGIQEHKVREDRVVTRYNRSRDVLVHRNDRHDEPELLGEGMELNRRLQQKLDLKSRDEGEKQPREEKKRTTQNDSNQVSLPDPLKNGLHKVPSKDGGKNQERDGEREPWRVWQSWVKQDHFYPEDAFWSEDMNSILSAMATYPITSFDVGHRGTQLKASMFLVKQRTAFKPMRYPRDEVIGGDPYAGFDRHNAEIAGFHLDGLLGFRIAPPVVGRRVNLTALWPVTTQTLRNTYFKNSNGDTCFYGKCYYCRKEEGACAEGEVMEGSVTLWLPEWYEMKTRRHPYQRTYRPHHKAKWETDDSYCSKNIISKPESEYYHGLLEFTDSCIFDFLMGNADRHHYETYANAQKHGKLLHIDNGKSFGNPHHDEMSILAPLRQCCRVRQSTWDRLQELISSESSLSQKLDHSLQRDPVYPVLTNAHLEAIDRRLTVIDKTVRDCFFRHGRETVLQTKWPPDP